MRSLVVFLLPAILGACGPKGGATTGGSNGASGPVAFADKCWPVAPLRMEALEHGSEWEPIVWMDASGAVFHTKRPQEPFAHIEGDRAIGKAGEMMCGDDHVVRAAGTSLVAKYDASDAFLDKGIRIFVNDDGTVEAELGGKKDPKLHARVVGDVKATRRTAELLVLLAMGGPP